MTAMMRTCRPSLEQLWEWLERIPDPEIPAVSIVDLGIVRDVAWADGADCDECVVTITPTYSGCPATDVIGGQIRDTLQSHGVERISLRMRLSPAWTTDWMAPEAREKLRGYGIAPPVGRSADGPNEYVVDISSLYRRSRVSPAVACPRCGSVDTETISQFGSTPCKALHRCKSCLEPFDYFKCH